MSLANYLPHWEFAETHQRLIEGTPEELYARLQRLDLRKSWYLRALFLLRGLRRTTFANSQKKFSLLKDEPGVEIILGLIAKPWLIKPKIVFHTREEFLTFNESGFAKMVWGFVFEAKEGNKTLVSTTTRIHCIDKAATRKFRTYWFFVRPFSNFVRKEMLRLLSDEKIGL